MVRIWSLSCSRPRRWRWWAWAWVRGAAPLFCSEGGRGRQRQGLRAHTRAAAGRRCGNHPTPASRSPRDPAVQTTGQPRRQNPGGESNPSNPDARLEISRSWMPSAQAGRQAPKGRGGRGGKREEMEGKEGRSLVLEHEPPLDGVHPGVVARRGGHGCLPLSPGSQRGRLRLPRACGVRASVTVQRKQGWGTSPARGINNGGGTGWRRGGAHMSRAEIPGRVEPRLQLPCSASPPRAPNVESDGIAKSYLVLVLHISIFSTPLFLTFLFFKSYENLA